MGTFINEVEATGGLKQERIVTIPVTVGFGDLEELEKLITLDLPASVTATVKRITSSAESADVIITRVGLGVDETLVIRALDNSGIRFSVGRIKSRKAGDAATDED